MHFATAKPHSYILQMNNHIFLMGILDTIPYVYMDINDINANNIMKTFSIVITPPGRRNCTSDDRG